MNILHTSDWHLGQQLYTKRRYGEFEKFLNWLLETIDREKIDCLIVAGDIFDTTTPSPTAQQLYFRFLAKVVESCCRHVVIVAGNHDSSALLDAPSMLLESLDIHVVSRIADLDNLPNELDREMLILKTRDNLPELLVCAVPFLRDQDVRKSQPNESWEEKRQNHIEGVREHYRLLAEEALRLQEQFSTEKPDLPPVPILATGHLLTVGGKAVEGDAVRELFVGSLGGVPANVFSDCFDYVALGHLHIPQKVDGSETIRYSGSPIPMGFNEAEREKFVFRVQIESVSGGNSSAGNGVNNECCVQMIPVPCFQRLKQLKGDWKTIESGIESLRKELDPDASDTIWLEIDYNGDLLSDLQARIDKAIDNSQIEVLRLLNRPRMLKEHLGDFSEESQTLADLSVEDTFQRCLESSAISKERHGEILQTFQELIIEWHEKQTQA